MIKKMEDKYDREIVERVTQLLCENVEEKYDTFAYHYIFIYHIYCAYSRKSCC